MRAAKSPDSSGWTLGDFTQHDLARRAVDGDDIARLDRASPALTVLAVA